jgi:hypothetical protein
MDEERSSEIEESKTKNIWLATCIKTNVCVIGCTREDNITFKTEIWGSLSLYKTSFKYSVLFLWLFEIKVLMKKTYYISGFQFHKQGKNIQLSTSMLRRHKGGSSCTASLTVNPSTRWRLSGHLHALAALPPGKTPEPTEHSAGWVQNSYWTFRRKNKSPIPLGNQILHHLTCSLLQGCKNV